jgi:inhibitor of KinA sporulation pathway (predicted exonuclease)
LSKKLDRILVIDLEATCWEGEPLPGQDREIIEIGLCVLDVATGQRLENPSILVHPLHSSVSEYCTALTTLTQQDVEHGISLREACLLLEQQYGSRKYIWASYGDYDRKQMRRECVAHGIDYPFGDRHINVKSLFAVVHNLRREVGLDRAMQMMGWPLEGTHHRGGDDAWNIARLLADILLKARGTGPAVTDGRD